MLNYSNYLQIVSLLLLLFNGSSIGFILFLERLGQPFGIALFCCTSLLGALLASISTENKFSYYANFLFFCHLVVTMLPLYYWGISAIYFLI